MKIKTILASLFSVVVINGAIAGTAWVPDKGAKCPIDDCPDIGGNISVGYDTDYVLKGVRLARDIVWGDVNYTFENLPFSPNIGIMHLTSLSSGAAGTDTYLDETNLYASVSLPSVLGFDTGLGYTHFLFPNTRGPSPGIIGDGLSQLTATLSRELIWGVSGAYSADYLFGGNGHNGGWMHTLALSKGFDITDAVGLDLSGGFLYNDNWWRDGVNGTHALHPGNLGNDSGWHSYFLRAALPIALNCRATLTPYVQYNGTPDGWTGDGFWGAHDSTLTNGLNANRNDVFSGGVSINVNF